jgi:hypothetical protein
MPEMQQMNADQISEKVSTKLIQNVGKKSKEFFTYQVQMSVVRMLRSEAPIDWVRRAVGDDPFIVSDQQQQACPL